MPVDICVDSCTGPGQSQQHDHNLYVNILFTSLPVAISGTWPQIFNGTVYITSNADQLQVKWHMGGIFLGTRIKLELTVKNDSDFAINR